VRGGVNNSTHPPCRSIPISFPYTYYVVLKPWSHSRLSCHFFSFGVFFQISFDNLRFQVASFNILISFSMFLCKFYYCTLFCVCVCFHFLLWAWILVFLQMSYISFGYNAPFKFNILSFVLRESTMIIVDINMINNAWQTSYGGGCDKLQHIFAQIDTLLLKLAQEPNHGTSPFFIIYSTKIQTTHNRVIH